MISQVRIKYQIDGEANISPEFDTHIIGVLKEYGLHMWAAGTDVGQGDKGYRDLLFERKKK